MKYGYVRADQEGVCEVIGPIADELFRNKNFPECRESRVRPVRTTTSLDEAKYLCADVIEDVAPNWAGVVRNDAGRCYDEIIQTTYTRGSYYNGEYQRVYILPQASAFPNVNPDVAVSEDACMIAHEMGHYFNPKVRNGLKLLSEVPSMLLCSVAQRGVEPLHKGWDHKKRQFRNLAIYCEDFMAYQRCLKKSGASEDRCRELLQPQYFVGAVATAALMPQVYGDSGAYKEVTDILRADMCETNKLRELGIDIKSTMPCLKKLFSTKSVPSVTYVEIDKVSR
jgi:hypothetical protein